MTAPATSPDVLAGTHLILRLPGLVAGGDLADALLDKLSDDYRGTSVIVDATRTSEASASFSARLTQRVLVEEGAASLILAGSPAAMVEVATEVATAGSALDRLHVSAAMPRRPRAAR